MPQDKRKQALAIARRSIEKAGGKIHRRGVNMVPAVKKLKIQCERQGVVNG